MDRGHLEFLLAAVEGVEDAVLELDRTGSVRRCNSALLRLLGHTEGRLIGTTFADLVDEQDAPLWERTLARALAGAPSLRVELGLRRRGTTLVPTRMNAVPLPQGDGPVLGVALMVRDVEEQRLAQATLAENAQRVAESEALSHVGSWAWDAETDAVQWSEELHRIHGLGPLDFDGTLEAHLEQVHPDDRSDVAGALRVAVHNGRPLDREFRVVRPDGEVRWVYARAALVRTAQGPGLRGIYHDITENHAYAQQLQDANERLTQTALYDRLTGLPNRSLLIDQLRSSLARGRRTGHRVDVLYLDVDDFKTINDSRGHHAGDEVLAVLAGKLREAVRATDTVGLVGSSTLARLHGDEFAVILDDCADPVTVVTRIERMLKSPLQLADGEAFVSLSLSIGIASARHPGSGDSPEALLTGANLAMHEAKKVGKAGHVAFAPHMQDAARDRHELGDELHRAMATGEFELAYQPVVNLEDGVVVGAEALIRWRHPRRGMVPPDLFIGRAEETGLILALGRWVLAEASRQAALWREQCAPDFTIAVNVSGRQLRETTFVSMVRDTLDSAGLSPDNLVLEMTESTLMERDDDAIAMLARLREDGVHLAIDDFGTGYSSLGSLRRLPVDLLKIDRSFVASLPDDEDAGTIAWAVVRLGHTLGLPVLAEGVETPEQRDALRDFGCDQAQGYLFGRPMPAEDLERVLREQAVMGEPARSRGSS